MTAKSYIFLTIDGDGKTIKRVEHDSYVKWSDYDDLKRECDIARAEVQRLYGLIERIHDAFHEILGKCLP